MRWTNQMAKTPENAIKLLTDLVPPRLRERARKQRDMQKLIDAQGGGFKLAAVGLAVLRGAGAQGAVRSR